MMFGVERAARFRGGTSSSHLFAELAFEHSETIPN